MVEVREVLRRWQAGQSARQIARDLVVDRKTAGRYIEAARECGLEASSELSDAVVAAVSARVQQRPELPPSEAWTALGAQRERIKQWLESKPPLRLVRVHELLARGGVFVSYTTLRRFAHAELGWGERRVTVRIDDPPPAQEAQVDFGLMGLVPAADGRRQKLWVLIVTLTLSRYMFVWPTFKQSLFALCDGLDAAWRFFGGVVHRIVPDNMTAAVMRAHPTDPTISRGFAEYAQSRGFFVDPARVRHAQDKPRVENQVPFVRERWFAGEQFSYDVAVIRESAETWSRDIAGMRVHGTTRKIPKEVYEAEELPHMLPPPVEPFDVPTWTRAKLHPDHHVQVARALYSAPTRYIGRRLEVRLDRTSVKLYLGTTLVKVHGRVAPGQRSTDPNDYPVGKAALALRSVDGLKKRAASFGTHVGEYAERLLEGPLPWIKMRQGYGLVRLCERYGAERVDALCARALAFGVIDVPRVERMLKVARSAEDSASREGKVVKLAPGRFARDAASFATRTDDDRSNEGGAS